MNQENSRFLHEINVPMESKFETIEDANQNEMLNDIVAMINAFQMATSRKSDAAQLVDLIVELSGAATVLNKLYYFPEKQKLDLKKRGYAHLAPEQLQLIYDKPIGDVRGPTFRTLSPYAFTNRIAQGLVLEAVTLSPHAFIPEILFPEGVVLYTLSPRAFIASVLGPQALIGRIISPSVFRAD
uniref:Uncharacterized protein n=1 Tax=Parascaris equorum TaxID=6256 RepID=A0A914RBI6_PAREQ